MFPKTTNFPKILKFTFILNKKLKHRRIVGAAFWHLKEQFN